MDDGGGRNEQTRKNNDVRSWNGAYSYSVAEMAELLDVSIDIAYTIKSFSLTERTIH